MELTEKLSKIFHYKSGNNLSLPPTFTRISTVSLPEGICETANDVIIFNKFLNLTYTQFDVDFDTDPITKKIKPVRITMHYVCIDQKIIDILKKWIEIATTKKFAPSEMFITCDTHCIKDNYTWSLTIASIVNDYPDKLLCRNALWIKSAAPSEIHVKGLTHYKSVSDKFIDRHYYDIDISFTVIEPNLCEILGEFPDDKFNSFVDENKEDEKDEQKTT